MNKVLRRILSFFSPLAGTGGVGVCPLCVVLSASVLTWLGFGALIPYWRAFSFVLLGLGFIGFLLDYRKHKNLLPVIVLVIGGVLLYLGRYVYGGRQFKGWPIWGPGGLLVIFAVFYNRYLFRKEALIEHHKFYPCGLCGLKYREKEWAEKCEAWCKEHQSCNIEITKHARTQ